MINVESAASGIVVSISGRSDELADEASAVIESIVINQYEKVKLKHSTDCAIQNADQMFTAIIAMSAERIKANTGIDILDLDIDDEFQVSDGFGSPFTMGMSGKAFEDFLMGLEGE